MRRMAARAGVLLAVAMTASCQGEDAAAPGERERASVVAEAEAVVAGLFAAMNARDEDLALAHYLPSEELIQVACTTLRQGYAERERVLRLAFANRPEATIRYQIVRTQPLGP